jgi:T4-like virus Myoviridae tail sheath stabiliser
MNTLSCNSATDPSRKQVYSPVPYNIDINLYVLTKNSGDSFQILEQILPYFQPEYTLQVKLLPELNVIQDVPVILHGVDTQDEYDGQFQNPRYIINTLSFTLKSNFFGPVTTSGVIKKVIVGLTDGFGVFTATGTVPTAPIIEGWLE